MAEDEAVDDCLAYDLRAGINRQFSLDRAFRCISRKRYTRLKPRPGSQRDFQCMAQYKFGETIPVIIRLKLIIALY